MEAADGEIYRKYADELTRFATGLVGPSDAADVVSDAVISCLISPGWSRAAEKRPYLYRSIFNKAAEFNRASRRRQAREVLAAGNEAIEMPEIRPEVLNAIFALSIRQRAVIVLTYWDDLDQRAIAALLGISDGSVRRHLARGRSRLKEVLNVDD